jgi:hypothetical protein
LNPRVDAKLLSFEFNSIVRVSDKEGTHRASRADPRRERADPEDVDCQLAAEVDEYEDFLTDLHMSILTEPVPRRATNER